MLADTFLYIPVSRTKTIIPSPSRSRSTFILKCCSACIPHLQGPSHNPPRRCLHSIMLGPPIMYSPSPFFPFLFLPQTRPDIRSTPLLELFRILPPQPRRLHIRRTLIVGATQHTDHTQKNGFGCLNRRPPFTGGFVTVWVVGRRMED